MYSIELTDEEIALISLTLGYTQGSLNGPAPFETVKSILDKFTKAKCK